MSPKYSDSPFKMIGGPTALASVEDWPSAPGFYTWAPGGKKIPVPDGMTPQEARARYMAAQVARKPTSKLAAPKRQPTAAEQELSALKQERQQLERAAELQEQLAPVTAENAELKRQLAKRERNAKGFAGKIRFAAGAAKPFGSKHEQRNAS